MAFKNFFEQGIDFKTYLAQGTEDEALAVIKAADALAGQLTQSLAMRIASLEQGANILIAGETWCPDCQLNITAISAMAELHPKIKVSIVSRDFAQENLLDKLDITEIKIPLVVVLDQYYQPKGLFIEQPTKVKESQDEALQSAYDNAELLTQTIEEVLDIIAR
ncbi:thioredoxin family protein [Marinomonas sp. PE14-40]|uniref:thioredoxin family protein n=1 Tax=Marinomonas sp. PE14-40 TaxID=3060621 RepID=UPI003F66CA0B